MIGKDIFQVSKLGCWNPEEAAAVGRVDRDILQTGQPQLRMREQFTRSSSNFIPLQKTILTSKVPLKDAEGQIIGLVGAYIDISDAGCLLTRTRD